MSKEQFIEEIAKLVQKYAPKYDVQVCSPIIAQACKESGFGKAKSISGICKADYHNYFGLKYRANRVNCNNGTFVDGSKEEVNGKLVPITDQWYSFENMEKGVEGYFQFINIPNYANVKGVTDASTYLYNLCILDHYCTSTTYVDSCMRDYIEKYNLTRFDKVQESKTMGYTNSPLVSYTKISPNKTSPRNHKIDTISIHCMAGNMTIESCGKLFQNTSRQASSNYGVGSDGRIGMYVPETDRSWCTSDRANDHRAVTIEVANDGGAETGWHSSDKAVESLIKLLADICKRNGIKKLVWSNDKNERVNHLNGCNMTVHRDYAKKSCPGDYLYSKHQYIADEVNKILS